MTDLITRIQSWYKTNCNGDWEHSYGLSLSTLDNPGWSLTIALQETALEKLDFNREYQSKENEHDWYFIRVVNREINIACSPDNLSQVLQIFLDEIIPSHADPDFLYDIYVPLRGYKQPLWTVAKGRLIKEDTLELVDVPAVDYKQIKVTTADHFGFTESDVKEFIPVFKAGDKVLTDIAELHDGVTLVAKQK